MDPMSNRAAKEAKLRNLVEMVESRRRRPSLLTIILTVATLLGGVVAVVTLLPRVTSSVSDPPNIDDPFSSSVTITNTGYVPLQSVTANLAVGNITFSANGHPVTLLGDIDKQTWNMTSWPAHNLGLDDRFTVALNDMFGGNRNSLLSAQVAIVVQYKLPWIHIHREKRFPLFAKRQSNGNFYWYSDTLPNSN
jgi:hypothetical protein